MDIAVYLALIVISIFVIGLVLLQAKGSGLGSAFGGDSMYSSRRGMERTLFNITVGAVIVFILLDLVAVLYVSR